jgi:transcriptional regulator with XRE-family HTH domain
MENLGSYIRKRRETLDFSLREFAKKLSCSAAFISDIELGRRHPSDKVLADIAKALDVKIEDLRSHDVRPPIEDIKRITQDDPTYALAFRTVIDKDISASQLLKFAREKGRAKTKK